MRYKTEARASGKGETATTESALARRAGFCYCAAFN